MNDKPVTEAVARRFLLGAVDDSERQEIESLFLIDAETKDTILIAEDELVEDYLEGSLSESDTAKFLEHYAHAPRQRLRLRIVESIKDYALAQSPPIKPVTPAIPGWRKFLSSGWFANRRLFVPAVVAVATVMIISAVWLVRWNNHRIRESNMHLSVEREFRDLNSPSGLSRNEPEVLSVVVPPVSLRSLHPPSDVTSQTAYRIIELQLLWTQREESQSYLAVIHRVGSNEKFAISNLQAEKNPGGRFIRLRLPARSLGLGNYEISLSGMPSGPIEQYDFVIGE